MKRPVPPPAGRPATLAPRTPMLTLDAVAVELAVSRRTVEAFVSDGRLPSVRLSARCRRVLREDLDAFLQARRIGG